MNNLGKFLLFTGIYVPVLAVSVDNVPEVVLEAMLLAPVVYLVLMYFYKLVSKSVLEVKTPEVEIRHHLTTLISLIGIGLVFVDPLVGGIFGFAWTAFVAIHFMFTAGTFRYSLLTAIVYEIINIFLVFIMDDGVTGMVLGFSAYFFGKALIIITIISMFLGYMNKVTQKAAKEKKIIL